MKRIAALLTTMTLAVALSAATARAQSSLGFTIDPTSGIRGSTVSGQVNVADVAANCNTTIPQLQAAFRPLLDELQSSELCDEFFPGLGDCAPFNIPTPTNYGQLSYFYLTLVAFAVSEDFGGASTTALPQTFVMTFADLATQTPVGPRGSFDPTTGVGSVEVPDFNPGIHPIVATCVEPNPDLLADAIRRGIQTLIDAGIPLPEDDPSFDHLSAVFEYGPQLLVPAMSPKALGLQLFSIVTPTLGFTIDPTSGVAGTTVNGQVNPADVAAHCNTTIPELQAAFVPLLEQLASPELCDEFFPGLGDCSPFNIPNPTNYDQLSYFYLTLVAFAVSEDFGGASASALPQTFVMTFADLATQTPVGDSGNFDPTTGVGSVLAPDFAPGLYPVVATCVAPNPDLAADAIREGVQVLLDAGVPLPEDDPNFDYLGSVFALGPQMLVPAMSPRALGLQLFRILADVDHFQCYRARTSGFGRRSVTLNDVFGTRSVTVRSPYDLCAPADKNAEDPAAPVSLDFLTSYRLSSSGPQSISGVTATNQFGTVSLSVRSPRLLMVPTAVSETTPPASPDGAFLNHFTCYDVRANGPTPDAGTVTVQTAFETVQIQPRKPKKLCVPTSKNDEPIVPSSPENLLCYQTKSKGSLNPAPNLFLANQFGSQTQRLGQRRDFCVPTDLVTPPR